MTRFAQIAFLALAIAGTACGSNADVEEGDDEGALEQRVPSATAETIKLYANPDETPASKAGDAGDSPSSADACAMYTELKFAFGKANSVATLQAKSEDTCASPRSGPTRTYALVYKGSDDCGVDHYKTTQYVKRDGFGHEWQVLTVEDRRNRSANCPEIRRFIKVGETIGFGSEDAFYSKEEAR